MWTRWLPWRFIVSRMARSQGFLDPIALLSRLHRFAQPSEVAEPIELLRAGVIFHARGLINARAIQHNLDWVWPYWVEQQFNPRSPSFVPRAFSITHINLTHRNWTAVGMPDVDWLPIVDPRGLVTPIYDGWSLDAWLILDDGRRILPSRSPDATQTLQLEPGVCIATDVPGDGGSIHSEVEAILDDETPTCRVRYRAAADAPGWLVISLRPVNPEGVSFIHELEASDDRRRILVNNEHPVLLDTPADRIRLSEYHHGDVLLDIDREPSTPQTSLRDDVGMATAAAMFRIEPGQPTQITARVPWDPSKEQASAHAQPWPEALAGHCQLEIPDPWMKFLYEAAVRSLILHAPDDVYPGPYTYKRFWFRDSAFILNALLHLGLIDRVERCIGGFAARQTNAGYFLSQEGEWDSNGAAMWIMNRFHQVSGRGIPRGWLDSVRSGAAWIKNKRLRDDLDKPHAGLLPAGFSAEHLGPNDFYYWDDFWCAAGLHAAAELLESSGDADAAGRARDEARRLLAAVDRSLATSRDHQVRDAIPASPYRRMDAGAIGSVTAGYPLQLWSADHPRLLGTVEFILANCMVRGGFFQDMIHSGVNAYLTLHLAQVLLRAGQTDRAFELVQATADLASPTGQWPEAIHPHTLGGCMGDGQHIWAAADWITMMRHLFVREENDHLVIGQGLPSDWLMDEAPSLRAGPGEGGSDGKAGLHPTTAADEAGHVRATQQYSPSTQPDTEGQRGAPLRLGPTPTPWGRVTVEITPRSDSVEVSWHADWRGSPPRLELRLVGCEATTVPGDAPQPVSLPRLSVTHRPPRSVSRVSNPAEVQ